MRTFQKNYDFLYLYPYLGRPKNQASPLIITDVFKLRSLQNYQLEFFHQGLDRQLYTGGGLTNRKPMNFDICVEILIAQKRHKKYNRFHLSPFQNSYFIIIDLTISIKTLIDSYLLKALRIEIPSILDKQMNFPDWPPSAIVVIFSIFQLITSWSSRLDFFRQRFNRKLSIQSKNLWKRKAACSNNHFCTRLTDIIGVQLRLLLRKSTKSRSKSN